MKPCILDPFSVGSTVKCSQPKRCPTAACRPWKYGFKSIKSIVKNPPRRATASRSGSWRPTGVRFYSNVNPDVSHPRWSQARERRIGGFPNVKHSCSTYATRLASYIRHGSEKVLLAQKRQR